jgi:hypothetical protein
MQIACQTVQHGVNKFAGVDCRATAATRSAALHELDSPNHENPAYVAKVLELRQLMERQLRGEGAGAPEA